ncbi:MAG TPA: hypothetical protein VEK73_10410 [Xanthobacteraceae bacterium]|nr:hypothetical protein [Xanthobacteraceae bacterium]
MHAIAFSAIAVLVAAVFPLVGIVRRRLGFETYRPELHYMRGPGPKWREKHLADSRGRA